MFNLARKIIILVIGSTVLLIGLILIVTPGPAIIVIPVGLAILGTEFVWARKLLRKIREEGVKLGTALLEAMPFFGKRYRGKDS